MRKSALTAAIKSGDAVGSYPTSRNDFQHVFVEGSFPCLRFQEEVENIEEQNSFKEIYDTPLSGTAQLQYSFKDGTLAADYELNPYNRRGGQEVDTEFVMNRRQSIGGARSGPKSGSIRNSLVSEMLAQSISQFSFDDKPYVLRSYGVDMPVNKSTEGRDDEKLRQRTHAAKLLRRDQLDGKVVVFITAGYSGKRFIFERAKKLNVQSVIIDGKDSWSQALVDEGIIKKFIGIDMAQSTQAITNACLTALGQVQTELGSIDGITTFCEMAVPLATALAQALKLPANSPNAVDLARDKHATRQRMGEVKLPTPKSRVVKSLDELKSAAEFVGYPLVIKPVAGAASIGVIRANNDDDLNAAFRRVQKDLSRAKIVAGALLEGGGDEATDETEPSNGNVGGWMNLTLMVEEYLDGPEVDCDLIFSEGKCVYGAVTDNWPTIEPYFNETGSNCPSVLPLEHQRELLELSIKAVAALGFEFGAFHVEGKYTSRGARLIEVNCRMGGGPVRNINLRVWGVDMVEEQLIACIGVPSRPLISKRPLNNIAEYSVNADATGVMQNCEFLKEWEKRKEMLYVNYLIAPGDKVRCVKDGLPTWVAEMACTMPTVQGAINLIKQILDNIKLPIK